MSGRKKLAIILLAIGLALWIAPIRALVLFILPLGSGFDDLLFVLACGIGLFLLFLDKIGRPVTFSARRKQFILVFLATSVVAYVVISMLL